MSIQRAKSNRVVPVAQSRAMKSPALIFFIVALSVFVSEAFVMLLLHYLPQLSFPGEAVAGATTRGFTSRM